jgi:hypothetical protein
MYRGLAPTRTSRPLNSLAIVFQDRSASGTGANPRRQRLGLITASRTSSRPGSRLLLAADAIRPRPRSQLPSSGSHRIGCGECAVPKARSTLHEQQIADHLATAAAGSSAPSHDFPATSIQGEGNPDGLAIPAGHLQSVGGETCGPRLQPSGSALPRPSRASRSPTLRNAMRVPKTVDLTRKLEPLATNATASDCAGLVAGVHSEAPCVAALAVQCPRRVLTTRRVRNSADVVPTGRGIGWKMYGRRRTIRFPRIRN